MIKIYVSSTFEDLKECRERVRLQLRKLGYEDRAMEYYNAEERTPIEKCLADVAACDVYIGVFAFRNGWVPPENNSEGLSITELEYRTAGEHGKERLVFLLDEDAPWPTSRTDDDKTLIKAARRRVSAHQRETFQNADDLAAQISAALKDWAERNAPETAAERAAQIDASAYFAALRRRYAILDLNALAPPQKEEFLQLELNRIFVEQNAREDLPRVELPKEVWEKLAKKGEVHPDDLPAGVTLEDIQRARAIFHAKPSRGVVDVICDPQYPYVTILGDPGSGKSTLARYILLSLIESAGDTRIQESLGEHLPILIELRNFMGVRADHKECKTFLDFLVHLGQTEGFGFERDALEKQLRNGKTLVIFDGLDEIFDPAERERITKQIAAFAHSSPALRVLVTSRIIGYRHKVLSDERFAHFTLEDLDRARVEQFVRQWFELALYNKKDEARDRIERILRAFDESASIRQLAGNPMLLTIMSIIGKNQELPRERYKLYEHASNVLIQHWDVNKFLKDHAASYKFIDETDKQEMLRRLAFKMQNGEGGLAGNHIQREELQDEFENYLKSHYELPAHESKTVAQAMIEQFHDRNFILSFYGADVYGFVHRAFLEYFCASAFVRAFEKTKDLSLKQLKQDVFGAHCDDPSWREVLRLICSMIDEKWVADILTYLVRDVNADWRDHLPKREPWHLALAVGCLSEVRNFALVAEPARELLHAVCDYLSRKRDSYLPDDQDCGGIILTAASYIGANWPHREELSTHPLLAGSQSLVRGEYRFAARFVGLIGADCEIVRNAVTRQCRRGVQRRLMAMRALRVGWPRHEETAKLIRSGAIDRSAEVRATSVSYLSSSYGSEEWAETLIRSAVDDEHGWVRYSALHALVSCCRDKPETMEILIRRAQDDKDVASAALQFLVEYYRNQYDAVPLLRQKIDEAEGYTKIQLMQLLLICSPRDAQVKSIFLDGIENYAEMYSLHGIVAHFADDQEVGQAVRDLAASKQANSQVRTVCVEFITNYHAHHPETLAFLEERAKKERSKRAKKIAQEGVAILMRSKSGEVVEE